MVRVSKPTNPKDTPMTRFALRLPTRRRSVYEMNHAALAAVIGDLVAWTPGRSEHFEAEGYMRLSVECIGKTDRGIEISLCHYGQQNGDPMRDPEMVVRVYPHGMVEALSIQMDYIGLYKVVYPAPNLVHPRQKAEQNAFLRTWLGNLRQQGHKLVAKTVALAA